MVNALSGYYKVDCALSRTDITRRPYRRALLLEEELEKSDVRLAKAVTELAKQSQRGDGAVRKRQQLENDNAIKEEENDKLENQVKSDRFTLAESERKYEDIARKLATKVSNKGYLGYIKGYFRYFTCCIPPKNPSLPTERLIIVTAFCDVVYLITGRRVS